MTKTQGEEIATLKANMANIDRRLSGIEDSVAGLHAKVDSYMELVTKNYVAKETFDEYKKNRRLENAIAFIIGAIITGLIAFFFRELGV